MQKKILPLIILSVFLLTGCTQTLKDKDNHVVTNKETGLSVTENIICQPTDKNMIKIYEENDIDLGELPKCNNFKIVSEYEGIWTSIFVKPLAWLIIQIGKLVSNYGLAIIITCLLIRIVLMPVTKKTAMQSENLKKAQPELEKLEKKYKNKTSQQEQTQKAQEMMMIYQKYQINPVSGCLLAFIQLPLLLAFFEAINRTPAIFESDFLVFNMATTPLTALSHGEYWYIILIALIILTTYISFKKTMKDQSGPNAKQMKITIYVMLVFILIASFTLPTALGIYWITSSIFTIGQNYWVERRFKNEK